VTIVLDLVWRHQRNIWCAPIPMDPAPSAPQSIAASPVKHVPCTRCLPKGPLQEPVFEPPPLLCIHFTNLLQASLWICKYAANAFLLQRVSKMAFPFCGLLTALYERVSLIKFGSCVSKTRYVITVELVANVVSNKFLSVQLEKTHHMKWILSLFCFSVTGECWSGSWIISTLESSGSRNGWCCHDVWPI